MLPQPNNWFLLRLLKSADCCRYEAINNTNTKLGIHLGTFSYKHHLPQSSVWPTDRPTQYVSAGHISSVYSHFKCLCKVTIPATEKFMFQAVTPLKLFIPYAFNFRYDWATLGHLHILNAVFFNLHVPYVNLEAETPSAFRMKYSNVQNAVSLFCTSRMDDLELPWRGCWGAGGGVPYIVLELRYQE